MSEPYRVWRGGFAGKPDVLMVHGDIGEILVYEEICPGGSMHPRTSAEAKSRPWFYTGSPFGAHIVGLAWERHGERKASR